jgi:hypothetical protein
MAKRTKIQALSELVGRAMLAAKMGIQYGGDRNIYTALGYPQTIQYSDVIARYTRQDIARAVIDRPVEASWCDDVAIQEAVEEETPLEKAWRNLCKNKDLNVISNLQKLDTLAGLGRYAVLLLGLSDAKSTDMLVVPPTEGVSLVYLKAYGEGHANIVKTETDRTNPRYGLPVLYQLTNQDDTGISYTYQVHHDRVLHVAQGNLEGDVYGESRLLPIWNRLMDLEKLVGGSAEMFWRNARPGYKGKIDDDFILTIEDENKLIDQLEEYEHNLRRFLVARGVEIDSLMQPVTDPTTHVDVQIQMISAQTGIPRRILTGSERGELASTQDRENWADYITARRLRFINHSILGPFIDRCIKHGVLPAPRDGYDIIWPSVYERSEEDRARVGEIRSRALAQYASQPAAEMIIPPEAFCQYFLGLSIEDLDVISKIVEKDTQGIDNEPA